MFFLKSKLVLGAHRFYLPLEEVLLGHFGLLVGIADQFGALQVFSLLFFSDFRNLN